MGSWNVLGTVRLVRDVEETAPPLTLDQASPSAPAWPVLPLVGFPELASTQPLLRPVSELLAGHNPNGDVSKRNSAADQRSDGKRSRLHQSDRAYTGSY